MLTIVTISLPCIDRDILRGSDNELEISPILGRFENDLLGVSWTLVEPPRVVKLTPHITVQSHRVVQLYYCTGSVLYCKL
jgi:hypothetical protein